MGDEGGPTEDEFEEEADDGMPLLNTKLKFLACVQPPSPRFF